MATTPRGEFIYMNTASFDYTVLHDSVAAELESLRAEKQLLAENIRTTELRLTEISLREEKLARLSESLTDLLTTSPSDSNYQADLSSASENEKQIVEENSSEPQTNESALLINETRSEEDNETGVNESEIATPDTSSVLDSDSESETVNPPATTDREFNKAAFFKIYPHLEGAQQPIHVLAGKLLEYLGRPTKLRDLTNYIVELGYRHHSQNFTNTVHTVLKNKRERNNGFYFDPKERMWELGHWRGSSIQSTITDKPAESNHKTAEQSENQQTSQQVQGKKKKTSAKIKVIKASAKKA